MCFVVVCIPIMVTMKNLFPVFLDKKAKFLLHAMQNSAITLVLYKIQP